MKANTETELTLVIPVYDGGAVLEATLETWREVVGGIRAEIMVIDDGSTDETAAILDRMAARKNFGHLRVIHQKNAGHGRTIRKGYESARGEWVFQADSDNEIEPRYFPDLWKLRDNADLVLGERTHRSAGAARWLVTFGEGLFMRLLGGRSLRDPNVPFRLIRSDRLKEFTAAVPPDEFAPNFLMSLWALRKKWRISVVQLPHNLTQTPGGSLGGIKLLKGCSAALAGMGRLLIKT